jgi:hypothetical protein
MAGAIKTLSTVGGLVTGATKGTIDTADITDAAVTYAKLQATAAASVLLGRGAAAGAGTVQEITLGTGLSMTGTVLSASAGSGTVTSVGLSAPSQLAVTGSPVTTSGTLALAWNTQTANAVLAGPTTGAAAAPTFRALVAADIPSGGGSPLTTKGDVYTFSTVNARLAVGTDGQVLTADSAQATGLKWAAPSSGWASSGLYLN